MDEDSGALREYVGFIWIGDEPGVRLSIWARNGDEAWAQVVAEYGEGHVISLRNEEDASRPRRPPSSGEPVRIQDAESDG